MKADCPERKAWLAGRPKTTPQSTAALGQDDDDATQGLPCLCTSNSTSVVTRTAQLPRIFVDVRASGEQPFERCRSAVDTCSVRTLMTAGLAEKLGVRVHRTEDALIALDWNSIATEGVAEVEIERFDRPVHLPRCAFQSSPTWTPLQLICLYI